MRIRLVLGLVAIAVALGMSHGVCWAQPECDNVYFRIYDPVNDPPCDDWSPYVDLGWTIHVTSSPTSVSAGTCSSFTLDNLYTDVVFYGANAECAGGELMGTCDIVATGTLSGYYRITNNPGGGCFVVCTTCAP